MKNRRLCLTQIHNWWSLGQIVHCVDIVHVYF